MKTMKVLFTIVASMLLVLSPIAGYAATLDANYTTEDSYTIPIDNNGHVPGDLNFSGVKITNVGFTTTQTRVSDSPCILYAIILGSSAIHTDYVTVIDSTTYTTGAYAASVYNNSFCVQIATTYATAHTLEWRPPYGIQMSSGLYITPSNSAVRVNVLWRNLKTK